MKVDSEKLVAAIHESPFGTGTLMQHLGRPVDKLHRIIALGSGEPELVETIAKQLGTRDFIAGAELLTVAETKARIEAGELSAADALASEKARKSPRTSLLTWLEAYEEPPEEESEE